MRLAFLGFVQQNMQSDAVIICAEIGSSVSFSLEPLNVSSDLIRILSICSVRFCQAAFIFDWESLNLGGGSNQYF